MIQDKELRDLFKAECDEHLQQLNEGFLRLEKEPKDLETLEKVFREAHSIKGAARMAGETAIEMLSHRLEDILGAARKGEILLSSGTIDGMLHGLDVIRKYVNEAVTGEPAGISLSDVLPELKPEEPAPPETASREKTDEIKEVETGAEGRSPAEPLPAGLPPVFMIETVRVKTKTLDALMTQAGELTVTRTHLARRLADMEEMTELWEELNKKKEKRRFAPGGAKGDEQEKALFEDLGALLNRTKDALYEDYSKIDFIADQLDESIRHTRLVPFSTLFSFFPRMVRDMLREELKEAEFIMEGADTAVDKRIIEEMKAPLTHMIRNAINHGIEKPEERESAGKPRKGSIRLKSYQTATNIVIELSDDGKGLDAEAIRAVALKRGIKTEKELEAMTPAQIQSLIFISGFSTSAFVTDVSGRGVGLDVVRENVERLKGTVTIESSSGKGSAFRAQLPITLATVRVIIAEAGGRSYAISAESIKTSRLVFDNEIFTLAGRKTITLGEGPVSVAPLLDLLELKAEPGMEKPTRDQGTACVILSAGDEEVGLLVDSLREEQEIVIKPHSSILKRVRNVSGSAILGTGEVCTVLNPQDLIKSVQKAGAPPPPARPPGAERKKVILLAEDSITTRIQEKRILESAGYEVVAAVDGADAFNKLITRSFDAVVSDIVMPNMDGLTLTEKIRQDKKYKELPVILVTTLASDEDKRRGMEAGANGYIPKPSFDQKELLEILRRLA
ncbi:MAG: hybrid sensor histidine kinase/response regulator [Nitrospirales bacterium]|nr:hybrid sensor histidine kinase/response regulator [Nitrospirales bacterium]